MSFGPTPSRELGRWRWQDEESAKVGDDWFVKFSRGGNKPLYSIDAESARLGAESHNRKSSGIPELLERRARDSNPQPYKRQLISNQPAHHSLTLLAGPSL